MVTRYVYDLSVYLFFTDEKNAAYSGKVSGMNGAIGGVGEKKIPPERDASLFENIYR